MKIINLINPAQNTDQAEIVELLTALHLPTADLPASLNNFLVARETDAIMGTVGIEQFGNIALLRSLAVAKDCQGKGLGNLLYHSVLDLAKTNGVTDVYLITNTAVDFFAAYGCTPVERTAVPAVIQGTAQFISVCPASATLMHKKIS
ncbi:MAG: amino acid acetyltransferase [Cytophagales bacterium CG18_big_fil_WC_8_21_14_2_50_42_9]|nr:MAG: amino acid acetyltransferase [Cytophagales bacterium CG18_big_fil_WC_8_21_14_2_50_42_9]